MIYLVGSARACTEWLREHAPETRAREIRHVSGLERAQGLRPRPSDRIIRLNDLTDDQLAAYRYLVHAQDLARDRRETSLRQAP